MHAAYLKPPKKTAAQLEQEAAPKFDPKWDGLFAELRAMTMGDLRIRALVEEVDEDAVYDSMDAADPKEALVELIVEAVRFAEEGPAGEPEQPGEDDPFGRKEREKELEAEEKRRRKAKARKRWRPQSSRSLVRSAKMRAATRIQAAWRGVHLRARRGRAREEAELAAEAAKHAELAGVLRTLELSCWDEAKMLPPEVEARERVSGTGHIFATVPRRLPPSPECEHCPVAAAGLRGSAERPEALRQDQRRQAPDYYFGDVQPRCRTTAAAARAPGHHQAAGGLAWDTRPVALPAVCWPRLQTGTARALWPPRDCCR